MPTIRQLKRRITSVQNTAKITNALQLVAASKMRRAQEDMEKARPYSNRLSEMLDSLIPDIDPFNFETLALAFNALSTFGSKITASFIL